MKKYFLKYSFSGHMVEKSFSSLFEFALALDKAQDSGYVLQNTIDFWTKDF